MSADEYMIHSTYYKYFKDEFNEKYRGYKHELSPKISTYFTKVNKNSIYYPQTVHTYEPDESNTLYQYLRSMVEESIKQGLPFIAFKMTGAQRYTPMCKYYKERCCTFDDTYRLYQRLGVKNYKEWVELFEKSLSNRKAVVQAGNEVKYFNEDETSNVDNEYTSKSKYEILFTNRK